MPRSPSLTTLTRFAHDLAGSLTVLSMCFPEVRKKIEQGRGAGSTDPHLHKCLQLCETALEELMQRLQKLRQYLELCDVSQESTDNKPAPES